MRKMRTEYSTVYLGTCREIQSLMNGVQKHLDDVAVMFCGNMNRWENYALEIMDEPQWPPIINDINNYCREAYVLDSAYIVELVVNGRIY